MAYLIKFLEVLKFHFMNLLCYPSNYQWFEGPWTCQDFFFSCKVEIDWYLYLNIKLMLLEYICYYLVS